MDVAVVDDLVGGGGGGRIEKDVASKRLDLRDGYSRRRVRTAFVTLPRTHNSADLRDVVIPTLVGPLKYSDTINFTSSSSVLWSHHELRSVDSAILQLIQTGLDAVQPVGQHLDVVRLDVTSNNELRELAV